MLLRNRLSILLFVLLLAAACGGGDDSTDDAADDDAATTTSDAPSSTTTEAPAAADSSAVAAELAGSAVTVDELQPLAEAIGSDDAGALSSWLLAIAMQQELADRGRPVADADLATSEQQLSATLPDASPTLVRLNAVFTVAREFSAEAVEPMVADAEPVEVLCSGHILLDTEAEAADVAALAQGGEDFAELAITYSTGPSGPNGGDLGCTATSTFVPEFGDGARANGVGITGPVESQFGWHVIQVRSIGPGTVEVHPELTDAEAEVFLKGAGAELAATYLDELVQTASSRVATEAEIDPAYGVWDEELVILVS